jgi:hypothetical protein
MQQEITRRVEFLSRVPPAGICPSTIHRNTAGENNDGAMGVMRLRKPAGQALTFNAALRSACASRNPRIFDCTCQRAGDGERVDAASIIVVPLAIIGDALRRPRSLPVPSIERWLDLRRWMGAPHKTDVTIDFTENYLITLLS